MNTPSEPTDKTVKSKRAFKKLNDNEKTAWLWNHIACDLKTLNETTICELKYQINEELSSFAFESNDGYSELEEGFFPFDLEFEDIVIFLNNSVATQSQL